MVGNVKQICTHAMDSQELMDSILPPNCNLLYLHSNAMKTLKKIFMKKVAAVNIMAIN